jgi:hypothetical protein
MDCPRAEDWLDVETVRANGAHLALPGEVLGAPCLTFDRAPSRLLWRMPILRDGRCEGTIAVVGASAFRERAVDDDRTG